MAKLPFLIRKSFDIKEDPMNMGDGTFKYRLLMTPKKNIWFYILMVKEFLFGQTVIESEEENDNRH